ncbi:MAG: hypothetical protein IPJ61_21695 [Tessaracoccus sp.]|uniref:hypothetical protein n=1 Tax=Tessaracoccus sp. TaxID=1971211 RepID=UPI001EC77E1E|nr:hypothetical protein [Tessaracoccus sp.]MBK7823604.1 hypothetical protein [Tessaracoccus sp.]
MPSPTAWLRVVYAVHTCLDQVLDTTVTIGPPLTQAYLRDGLIVAGDTTSEEGLAGDFEQSYRTIGGPRGAAAERDDEGSIVCEVWAQSGDDNFTPLLDRAFALMEDALDALRDNVGLGLPDVLNLELAAGQVYAGPSEDGAFVRLPFTVHYTAVI